MEQNRASRWNGLKTILVLIGLLVANSSWAKPPYQVMGYCFTTTKTSATSLNGNAGNINWSTDVPWQDLTVAEDAFMIPNTNNTFSNGGAKNATLVNAAHANGTRCVVSFGGAGQDGAFPTVCQSSNREAFASAVTAFMMQYGYDGAEIDWETPNSAAQSDATAMMEDLYNDIKALPNSSVDGKPRTLSFTTVDYIDQIYNMSTLGNYTDWCFFMGYDWYACPSLENGPLDAEQTEIASMTDGQLWSYPISKMVLGCPLYANDYNTSSCTANEYNVLSILHLGTPGAYNSSWAEQAYTAPNGHTVYVDTAQSYCDKTNWALNNHLMGIGMWDVGMALPYTDSAVAPIWNTIGGTASCLNLGPTATPTKTATPVVASTWRVNAGGPSYTDSQGHVWAADENFTGGTAAVTTSTITGALPAAADQALYQSQRYGSPFTYSFNVPAGSYQVTLKFAETYWTAAGQRVFNVSINGNTVLTNFDIFKTAGAQNKAIDEVFSSIAPSGGTITIQLGPASADNGVVQAIQIVPQPGSPTATPTYTSTPTSTFTATFTPTRTTQSTWRVVAGGPAHTDCQGNVWAADENFTGGTAATSTNTITGALPCSTDGALYQDQRYGSPFTYSFNVPTGSYQVTLKFAETYWTAAGQRVFNVSINGSTVLTNFDIFKTTGAQNKAIDEVFNNVAPSGGVITIQLGPASVDNAMVDSIQIVPQPGLTPTNTPTNTSTFTPTNTFTSVGTATSTYTPTFTPTTGAGQTWRVVAGGPAHTDCQGNVWAADENFSGGTAATSTNTITAALPCSTDGALYQDQRYGSPFTYTFSEPAGSYQVTLKFAETYFTAAGDRVFNVSINGNTVLTNFDIFKTAGAQNKAIDEVFNNIVSSGGAITITFGPASVNYALISSIQVIPQPATPTPTPIPQKTWRVVAGGPAHTDCQGNVWAADENFSGGTAATSTNTVTGALPCSTDGALYQDQRYGSPFTYTFSEPAGSYQVTLKFAETYWTAAGDRVFNVSINGSTVLTNFDIFKTAGGENKAIDEVFSNITSPNGAITVTFGPASVNYALISSIQVVPQGATGAVKALIVNGDGPTPTATTGLTIGTNLPLVSVWPNVSKGGQPILFKMNSDQAGPAQLAVYSLMGEAVYQTSFGAGSDSFLWRLQNQAGANVASGLYIYVLRFENNGSPVVLKGKVSVVH